MTTDPTPDRVAKLRAAVLAALPKDPPAMPFTVQVRVRELESGEFIVTADEESTQS